MKTITRLAELKRLIAWDIKSAHCEEFPTTYIYQESLTSQKYEVTIRILENDTFVDEKGNTWKKVIDE